MSIFARFAASLACLAPLAAFAQQPCTFTEPAASLEIHHVKGTPPLTLDPNSKLWRHATRTTIDKDCHKQVTYSETPTTVRSFWTDKDVYFLFECHYKTLNVFLPADNSQPRNKLWDRDVVELFIGYDWKDINHYREFEVAPTGDWIDLAIDLNKKSYDWHWRSHWQTMAKIDESKKIWYAAVRIPLASISPDAVHVGDRWRMDLYRIDGPSPDANRHFMCWQPICTPDHPSNHTPARFGTLVFNK